MKRKKYLLIYISVAVMFFAAAIVTAEDNRNGNSGSTEFSRTKDGLKFNVPEDWPIVKRAGAVAPIPIEEYLALKFREFDSRLDAIEQRLASFELVLQKLQETQNQVLGTKKQEPEEPNK